MASAILDRRCGADTLHQARFAELRELVWSTLMAEAREAEFHLAR